VGIVMKSYPMLYQIISLNSKLNRRKYESNSNDRVGRLNQ